MAEDVTDALEIVKQAMETEQEGREFYLKAAQANRITPSQIQMR